MEWTTVATFGQSVEAVGAQTALEAEGIPVLLPDAQMTSLYPANLMGGIRLQVPADRVADAEALLAAFTAGNFEDATEDGEAGGASEGPDAGP